MWISPIFADLTKMKAGHSKYGIEWRAMLTVLQLPSALFTCGTLDCLLDDSVFMSAKWSMAGAESILKIYPGAPHGFVFFPPGRTEETQKGLDDITMYMNERI